MYHRSSSNDITMSYETRFSNLKGTENNLTDFLFLDGNGPDLVFQGCERAEGSSLRHGGFVLLPGPTLRRGAFRVPRGGRLCTGKKPDEHVLYFLSRRSDPCQRFSLNI